MEKKITSILKENNLYDENKMIDISNCSKLDEFFDSYKYNPTSKQHIPSNVIRDDTGKILLNEIPFIVSNQSILDKEDLKWIILNNGTRLLIKERDYSEYQIYNELEIVIMYFLKSLNISCANYDIAILDDKEVLITPSFLSHNEKIITFDNPYNIKEFYEFLKQYGMQIHYLKTIFSGKMYGDVDRFPRNFGRIDGINKKGKIVHRNCPLFDNAEKNAILKREKPYLNNVYVDNQENFKTDVIFSYLLTYEEIMSWVKTTVSKVNLDQIIEKIKTDKNIIISSKAYSKINNFFKDSEAIINDELKSKGQSFKIKLT